jgi:hypothetical protein
MSIKIPKERSLSTVYLKSLRSIVVIDCPCPPFLSTTMLYTTNNFNKLKGNVWIVQSNETTDHDTFQFHSMTQLDGYKWFKVN